MAGDNKQLDLRPADPFTRIDSKLNQVVPWSRHAPSLKISCKSVQPFSHIMLLTKKQTKKEIEQKQNPVPRTGAGYLSSSAPQIRRSMLDFVRVTNYSIVLYCIVSSSSSSSSFIRIKNWRALQEHTHTHTCSKTVKATTFCKCFANVLFYM